MTEAPAAEKKKHTRKPAPPPLSEILGANALHSKLVRAGTDIPVNPDSKRNVRRDTAPRDKFQRQIDHDAEVSYKHWLDAGKPDAFKSAPRVRYEVPPEAVESLVKALDRATGSGGPESVRGKTVRYRPGKIPETGLSVIEWFISDRRVRTPAAS